MRNVIELVDQIYVKVYGFLSFAKNMGKKCGQTLLYTTKKSAADTLKIASDRGIQKTAETTGNLFGNKIIRLLQRVVVRIQENCLPRKYHK